MNNLYFAILLIILSACSGDFNQGNTDTAIDGPEPSREWQPVWSDEFDGDTLDTSKWNYQIGDGRAYVMPGWGNNEEQYYTDSPDNVRVEAGNLIISARADGLPMSAVDPQYGDPNQDYSFTSARVNTSEKFEFTYGRVEAKIKMQSSSGLWHAFWLLGSETSPYGGWPQKGEIDVMEAWVHDRAVIGSAAHFGTSGVHQYKSKNFEVDFDDGEYHIYAVEWDSEQIRWFVDGEHFYTLTRDSYWNYYEDEVNGWQGFVDKNADEEDDNLSANLYADYQNTSINAPFDKDQYIILNTAVNGNLPSSADEFADPNGPVSLGEMHIDYVRVYQCPEDPLLPVGTGCKQSLDTFKDEPYYANPSFRPEFPAEQSSFALMTDLYVNGQSPEPVLGVDYIFQTNNAAELSVIANPSEPSNNYLLLNTFGIVDGKIPRLSLTRKDDDKIILGGFGGGSKAQGDIKFDLYIEELVGVGSGEVSPLIIGISDLLGKEKFVLGVDLKPEDIGRWQRVTVSINDILSSRPTINMDLQKLYELLTIQVLKEGVFRIDNIQLACGGSPCGIINKIPVFIDEVSPLWTKGIRGNDAQQKSTLFENPDYTENDQHHVQWSIFDTGEQGHDYVIETTIGTTRSETDPLYPSEAVNFIGSENAISAIAALTEGEFRFDIRMMHNPNDVDLYFKVDGASSTTGEQTLGDLPIGEWEQFACPIENLILQGLDVSSITAPFVMVPGVNGSGKDVVFQWDNVIFSPVISDPTNIKVLTLPVTFDQGGFCLPVSPFLGGSFQLARNPSNFGHSDPEVGKTIKSDYGVTYGGIRINLSSVSGDDSPVMFDGVNSPEGKRFTMKVLSPRNPSSTYANPLSPEGETTTIGPMTITFKLEPTVGSGGSPVSRKYTLTKENEWEEAVFDFNGVGENEFNAITILIDDDYRADRVVDNWSLYFDDISQSNSITTVADLSDVGGFPVVFNFDQLDDFVYPEPQGYQGARGSITIDPDGESGNVGRVVYDVNEGGIANRGITLVGSGEGFPRKIPFDVDARRTTISLRVHTPEANTSVLLKVENAQNNTPPVQLSMLTAQAGWSTLNFTLPVKTGESYEKLGIIFDQGDCIYNPVFDPDCQIDPNEQIYYFDDIQLLVSP